MARRRSSTFSRRSGCCELPHVSGASLAVGGTRGRHADSTNEYGRLPPAHASCRERRQPFAEPRSEGRERKAARDVRTLVFLEHHGGELVKNSLAVVSKAASLGGDVHGVAIGSGV